MSGNTDRAQLSRLSDAPFVPLDSANIRPHSATRAEWDALLERIAEIEGRVGELDRRSRGDVARFSALRRRDKLRGGR